MSSGANDKDSRPSARPDLENFVQRFLAHLRLERGRSANTVAAYRGDLGLYLAFLSTRGIPGVSGLTPDSVHAFVSSLTGKPRSVNRRLSAVRSFHRFLVEEGVLPADPGVKILPPSIPDRLPKALRIDQVQTLLDSITGDDPVATRDRALLELLYATGCRVSEAITLAVDDVLDTGGGALDAIRVTGKGDRQRVVPLGSHARKAIEAWLVRGRPALQKGARASGPGLFLGVRGGPLSRQNAWLIITGRAEAAGLAGLVSPHTLRHSCATHLIQGGADVRVVQELLGHRSVTTTQIYTRVTIDTLKDVFHSAHPRAR